MVKSLFGLVLVLAALAVSGVGQGPRALPSYEVLKTPVPIQVDGRLDEPVWSLVEPVGPFVNNVDGSPSALQTEAWVVHDDEMLYFAFRCADENIWATMSERDEHLWEEEVVEVFLQGDPLQPSYIELEVNPLGAMLDIFLIDVRRPIPYKSWNSSRLKWAVEVDGTVDGVPGDRQWTCEIALPFEEVVTARRLPPVPGDRWKLNLYRVEAKPAKAGLAWSPTLKPDFHVPARFGDLIFTGRLVPIPVEGAR
jgi:hypothetical protein